MKIKTLLIYAVTLFGIYFFYREFKDEDVTTINIIGKSNVLETKRNIKKRNNNIPSNSLISIAQEILPLNDKYIENNWEYEFGCKKSQLCNYQLLNAESLAESRWMQRKGYLSKSIIDKLKTLSIKDLSTLANRGNIDAQKLMSIYYINKKNVKNAKGYATRVRANEQNGETFGLRLTAQAYLLDSNPMLATIELRMAALLGDADAAIQYENLTQNSARAFIDHVNVLAYNFLSSKFQRPIQEWNNSPRPSGGGG